MRGSTLIIAIILAPLGAFGAPRSDGVAIRQSKFCERSSPAPPDAEVKARHDKFVDAFLVKKDVVEAFTYIAADYINNGAANGAQGALDFLSRVWKNQTIAIHRTQYNNNTSLLNYDGSYGKNIIDRYRWTGGCIAEHWDRGEVWPAS
ncbi:hypothetical protein B0T25DRAFT_453631 [Lasiosphaeria hispida]|uniref:SnoaL-like domain-containing protein n=1 Tax=Lasiosphaeria hispida TaxID=260671 RepID=A0AAJ0MDS8_9PEZI|nr:hypothetical protein B0T25DRAFT_453631 [Lasiosphaeria hispida]